MNKMKHKINILFVVILTTMLSFSIPVDAQVNKNELQKFIHRIIPEASSNFNIEYIEKENNKDVFEIEGVNGKIVLRGNNGVSIASALKYYLEHFCHNIITWNGSNLKLPSPLPIKFKKVHKVSPYKYRYNFNYCTFNYSMSWWDWERWQKEIDWMALNGINMPLALTGQEAIWQEVYLDMGFTQKELDGFFSAPTHFAWLWMGNLDGWGGPLPQNWIDTHKELQKQILKRERVFGMRPVLPAFSGHVPPSFKDRFPNAKLIKTNWGHGFEDTYLLDANGGMFTEIGTKFIKAQTKVYGTNHLYSSDTFNENDPPYNDSIFLDGMSKKIYHSMSNYDPDAIWVMQGWMFSYNSKYWQPEQMKALLNAVPDENMIILDLYSEAHPVWNKTNAYYGKPWIWNLLSNFGGNISMFGRMRHVAYDPAMALHDPESGNMAGIGLTMEGIEQNPALFQLMTENVWRDEVIKLDEWLKKYAYNRYGKENKKIDKAWQILKNTVYSGNANLEPPESIITGRPTFNINTNFTVTTLSYDPIELLKAWKYFIEESDSFKNSEGYKYDVVDITRQVLANYATPLQQQIAQAYRNGDKRKFEKYSKAFLDLISDMDDLLGTTKDFLLGPWIADARNWGVDEAEKNLYEFNARDLITLWGDRNGPIHDYSCRQWSGLLNGFYKPRWELFFSDLDASLKNNVPMDYKAFEENVKDLEWKWVNSHEYYPVEPTGNPITVSKNMYNKYVERIKQAY